jgi:SAM-dependent methyltransferase
MRNSAIVPAKMPRTRRIIKEFLHSVRIHMTTEWAPTEWNAHGYAQISELQLQKLREVLGLLNLEGTERILDVGCGQGKITAQIAARVPHGSVIGIDPSAEMILSRLETSSAPVSRWLHAGFNRPGLEAASSRRRCEGPQGEAGADATVDRHTAGDSLPDPRTERRVGRGGDDQATRW